MKTIYQTHMLLAGLFLLYFSLSANTTSFDSFEDHIAKGVDALHQHDAHQAKQYFTAAKKEGKGQQKKYARRLIRKMRYLDNYCFFIKKGEQFIPNKNFRAAYENYQKAQSSLEASIRKYPIPDLDSELGQIIKMRIQQTNRERKTAFQNAVSEGQQYLYQDDPHTALIAFKYAKDQMYRQEYMELEIEALIADAQRKADYRDFLAKGSEYLAEGDLHNARDWFYKAKGKWETSEVAQNIEEVEVLLIEAYISEGESYFTVGAYEKALNSFQNAINFRETNEVINWIKQTKDALYYQFLMEGDTLSGQQAYPEAIAAFQKAQSYWNTAEIVQRILRAEADHYEYLVDKGQLALQQDSLEKALHEFQSAAAIKLTESVQSLIVETKDRLYQKYHQEAQDSLKTQAFSAALAIAKQAQAYRTTPEIQTLIKQSENGLEYEKRYQEGLNYLQNKQVDQAHQAFVQAKSFWITEEVKQQITDLETLFANFEAYKSEGDLALEQGELEEAVTQYKLAREVCIRENIEHKIAEVETRLEKYNDYFQQGKTAYQLDNAEQALQHFEQAAQYNRTSAIENWIDRAKRMPCTIAVNLHGDTDKFDNIHLEVVDFYTLDMLYKADPGSSNYTFPKVPGGGDKKYYLRAFLVENGRDKVAIKEVACDCAKQRKHEIALAVE